MVIREVSSAIPMLYLHRMQGRASVPIVSTVGSRLPMHATGVGKVLLAHSPDDVHDRVMANLVIRSAPVRWRYRWCSPPTVPWWRRSASSLPR